MAKKKRLPADPDSRPQRTREHVIADLSVNYVERFIYEAGHSAVRVAADYGYDLMVQTFDQQGYAEDGFLYLQLKATDVIAPYERRDSFAYPIKMRHYKLWHREPMPVFFVLYDAARRRAAWLYAQPYFAAHPPQTTDAATVTVHVPRRNVFGKRTIERMRQYKAAIVQQIQAGVHHHD